MKRGPALGGSLIVMGTDRPEFEEFQNAIRQHGLENDEKAFSDLFPDAEFELASLDEDDFEDDD